MSIARYRAGPRSVSTVRRWPSTTAFSIFRLASDFASTARLVNEAVALGPLPFVVCGRVPA
jgi:hypothetical protein